MHRLNFEQKWQFSTHFAKTRFCAWIFINATNQAAVTAQAVWEAPIPKCATITFFSCVTFSALTLAWPSHLNSKSRGGKKRIRADNMLDSGCPNNLAFLFYYTPCYILHRDLA